MAIDDETDEGVLSAHILSFSEDTSLVDPPHLVSKAPLDASIVPGLPSGTPEFLKPPLRVEALKKPTNGRSLFWFDPESVPRSDLIILTKGNYDHAVAEYQRERVQGLEWGTDIPRDAIEDALDVRWADNPTPLRAPFPAIKVLAAAGVTRLGNPTQEIDASDHVISVMLDAWESATELEYVDYWAAMRVTLLAARYADAFSRTGNHKERAAPDTNKTSSASVIDEVRAAMAVTRKVNAAREGYVPVSAEGADVEKEVAPSRTYETFEMVERVWNPDSGYDESAREVYVDRETGLLVMDKTAFESWIASAPFASAKG